MDMNIVPWHKGIRLRKSQWISLTSSVNGFACIRLIEFSMAIRTWGRSGSILTLSGQVLKVLNALVDTKNSTLVTSVPLYSVSRKQSRDMKPQADNHVTMRVDRGPLE